MAYYNSFKVPFTSNEQCNPPTEEDEIRMNLQHDYQIRDGHIRCLVDSTRPELAYAAAILGAVPHKPIVRHQKLLQIVIWNINSHVGARSPLSHRC